MSKHRKISNAVATLAVVTGTVFAATAAFGAPAQGHSGHSGHGDHTIHAPAVTTEASAAQISATYQKLPPAVQQLSDAYNIAKQVASSGKATELLQIYAATAKYLDINTAKADGFQPLSPDHQYCVANLAGPGAMGYHYMNFDNIMATAATGTFDITKPHVLIYVPDSSGNLRLGAVEWAMDDADQDLSTSPDRPSIIGLPFEGPMLGHEPLPDGTWLPIHFDKHMWLYTYNPNGIFTPHNPNVTCPPGSTPPPHP